MTSELTAEMIDAGRKLLELIDRRRFRVPACFWFYFIESDRWRLVVASPDVRTRAPLATYRKIGALARKVPNSAEIVAPGGLTVVRDDDPLIILLRRAVGTSPGTSGFRFARNVINGTLIEDAYIYRLTASPGRV